MACVKDDVEVEKSACDVYPSEEVGRPGSAPEKTFVVPVVCAVSESITFATGTGVGGDADG